MDILIKLLQFFLCFTIIVGLHEFGHYIMARIFKIRVEKFFIFFDPWFSLFKFKHKDTVYGLGWLPLGGYVQIGGMIDESMDKSQIEGPVRPDDFRAKPAWQRFMVMVAGVVMNLLTAIVIYCAVCYTWGESYLANEDVKWGYEFNEAAEELGFVDGDKILTVNGEKIENAALIVNALLLTDGDCTVEVERDGEPIELMLPMEDIIAMRRAEGYKGFLTPHIPFIVDSVSYASAAALQHGDRVVSADGLASTDIISVREYIQDAAGEDVRLTVERAGNLIEVVVPVTEEGKIGVSLLDPLTYRTREYSFLEAIPAGLKRAGTTVADYWNQLKLIVKPETKMYEELGGFIAIGSIFAPEWNWLDFWLKTAFLSIILAVMNILPIPALDGGHALFTFWEMLTGRKVSDKVLEVAQYIGLGILLVLLVYANGNDIYRFFIK
ncbi:MAG: RIP metalloprotease RseP [Rikenellaceae bacterium]|nr:RIP metalloprotease RseP [Rikenellaceae bacterium]